MTGLAPEPKVAVVTGGGTGIGLATVEELVAKGDHVLIVAPDGATLEHAANSTGAAIVVGDAADSAVAARAVEMCHDLWGRLDMLISCAGVGTFGNVGGTSDDEWESVLGANLSTAAVMARACLPDLVKNRGTIVLVSSLAGVVAVPQGAAYTVSKHALIGLARSLAGDFGPLGVRTNVVCPGQVRTAMLDSVMDQVAEQRHWTREEAYAKAASLSPRRAAASPKEIADVILFLAGDRSAAINGAVIMADGGVSAVDLSMAGLHDGG